MDERFWQLSASARDDERLAEFAKVVDRSNKDRYRGSGTFHDFVNSATDDYLIDGLLEESDEIYDEYLVSKFYQKLDQSDKARVIQAIDVDETHRWGYGDFKTTPEDDAFFGLLAPQYRIAARPLDGFVLSGLIGAQLMRGSKKVREHAKSVEVNPLDRAILVGGIAVALAHDRVFRIDGSVWSSSIIDGVQNKTYVGGDIHGDFRALRRTVPQNDYVTPFGGRVPFGPEPQAERAGAYHSSEPLIVAKLLQYMTVFEKRSASEVYRSILQRLPAPHRPETMLYANYGDKDGDMERADLAESRKWDIQEGDILHSLTIDAGMSTRLHIRAENGGVRLINSEYLDRGMFIPSNELEDCVVAMFSVGYGRTSYAALRNVLEGLID